MKVLCFLSMQQRLTPSAFVNVFPVFAGRAPEDDVRHATSAKSESIRAAWASPHFGSFAAAAVEFRGDREESLPRPLLSQQREVRSQYVEHRPR